MREGQEDFDYGLLSRGLPITLLGVPLARCATCGEWEVGIRRTEDLQGLLARSYVRKHGRLAPGEVRYMREWLGWSAADFAANMGVTTTQVSRWENGMAMGVTAERLLRVVASQRCKGNPVTVEELRGLLGRKPGAPRPLRMILRRKGGAWVREDGERTVAGR